MYSSQSEKFDNVLKGLDVSKKADEESDLKDVVHSLCYNLENNVSPSSYIDSKILPLKMIFYECLHRKCMTE